MKIKILFFTILFLISFNQLIFSQVEDVSIMAPDITSTTHDTDEIFVFVEDSPEFLGGDEARITYLRDNVIYPELAKQLEIQGTVYVTFVIEKDGSISNAGILRGIGGGCDEEAIRVISNMPKWKPGTQRGQVVRVKFNMPIKFTLYDNNIYDSVDVAPTFIGGDPAKFQYLVNNILYPLDAKEGGIQGTVYASFVVEKDGSITNVQIIKGIGGGCDEEVIRIISNMPKWNPGTIGSKVVRTKFTLPLKFSIAG